MSELPEGWASANLSDVVLLNMGQSPKGDATNVDGLGLPLIGGAADYIGALLSANRFTSAPTKVCAPGDLILCIRATIGKIAVADQEYCLGRGVAGLTPLGLDREYLRYFICSEANKLDQAGTGSTFRQVDKNTLSSWPVPIPPFPEQRRIVAKLDSLFERTRRAREELSHIPRLIENYKKAILEAAFRGDLTRDWRKGRGPNETASELIERTPEPQQPRGGREATDTVIPGVAALSVNVPDREPPEGWIWVSLRRVARQETGHTPSRKHPEYWGGDIPWIGIRDAADHHGGIINDTVQHPTQLGIDNSSARVLPADTICLSRTASVGYIVRMGRPMATSQDFVTWTCSGALDPDYLLYALLAEGEEIRRFGKGSTHTTIYFPEVRALHICLAPFDEQRTIVRRVKAALSWAENIRLETERAAALIPNLDQANLAKAFRGELVPQDPNDEPASVLLERIRAERAGEMQSRRGRRGSAAAGQEARA
jgi:type I restriction enzyme, S subunit